MPRREHAGPHAPRADRPAAPRPVARWPGAAAPALAAALAAGWLLTAPATAGAQQEDEVEISASHVAGSVYMIRGRGGNIGVSVGEDGVLMVDDQFAPLAPRIRAVVDSLAGGGDVDYVLNTHWHHDHTDGNKAFGRETPVLAHHNVRDRLASPQVARGDTTPALPARALPDVTFGEGISVHLNGEEIRVRHFPRGHTDGDAVVFFTGSDVVHMGDHMFAGQFPFVDLATGGSVQGYTRNVAAVLEGLSDDAAVIPGHGSLTDVEGLRAYHRMLVETTEIVRGRLEEGMSLEEAKAAGLPDEWASWGQGFISTGQWIETVYRSLSRARSAARAGGDAGAGRHRWHPHGHDGHGVDQRDHDRGASGRDHGAPDHDHGASGHARDGGRGHGPPDGARDGASPPGNGGPRGR